MLFELLILLCAYCVGSIPSGFLISRARGIRDIRLHGSGNIGATNVGRILGYKYFFIVFFADFLKSYAFLRFIALLNINEQLLLACCIALLIGNAASIFLKFRGGKGIATLVGILLAIIPFVFPYVLCIWLCVAVITRVIGIASVVALVSLPLVVILLPATTFCMMLFLIVVACLGIYWHRDNVSSFITLYKISGNINNKQ